MKNYIICENSQLYHLSKGNGYTLCNIPYFDWEEGAQQVWAQSHRKTPRLIEIHPFDRRLCGFCKRK